MESLGGFALTQLIYIIGSTVEQRLEIIARNQPQTSANNYQLRNRKINFPKISSAVINWINESIVFCWASNESEITVRVTQFSYDVVSRSRTFSPHWGACITNRNVPLPRRKGKQSAKVFLASCSRHLVRKLEIIFSRTVDETCK